MALPGVFSGVRWLAHAPQQRETTNHQGRYRSGRDVILRMIVVSDHGISGPWPGYWSALALSATLDWFSGDVKRVRAALLALKKLLSYKEKALYRGS
jgi:hypothetical protein